MFQKRTFMNIKMSALDIAHALMHDDDSVSDRTIETMKKFAKKHYNNHSHRWNGV